MKLNGKSAVLALLVISLFLPRFVIALSFDLSSVAELSARLGEFNEAVTGVSLEAHAEKTLSASSAENEAKLASARKALLAATLSVGDWFGNLRTRFLESVQSVPSAPQPSTEGEGPRTLPVENRASQPSVQAAAPIQVQSNSNSITSRLASLENQLVAMRQLFTRQSEKSSERVSTIVTQAVTNISSSGSSGDGSFSTLSVSGIASFGTATSTASNGFDISAGCFSINGVCIGGGGVGGGSTFSFPFLTLGSGENSTSTTLVFQNGFLSTASSTLASTTVTSLLARNATTTNLAVTSIAAGSLVKTSTAGSGNLAAAVSGTDFVAPATTLTIAGTAGQITSSAGAQDLSTNRTWTLSIPALFNIGRASTTEFSSGMAFFGRTATTTINGQGALFVVGSTTLQAFSGINFTALGSSTLQSFVGTAYTAIGSTTLQDFTSKAHLALGSTTLQNFTGKDYLALGSTTLQSATSTNFSATSILSVGSAMNFLGRSTTTLVVSDTAWVIATNTAATAAPLMSFNNSAGTSTIQFFGATTTGLTAGVGQGIPMGNFVLIGDGRAPASINILKGGLCVAVDGWCTASTTGRISSRSSYIGASDLAEMYKAEEHVEPGDVVAITSGIGIKKALSGGKDRMMGVVSTNPGIVLGTIPDEQSRIGDTPIALTGRVPVKVSTENGVIHAGDYLALSSLPGVAAKAIKAGSVVGQALEDYSGSGVGKVMTFVKNSYYSGLSLDNFPGLTTSGVSIPEALLIALKDGARTTSAISSDLTVDRMLAAVEIITPKIYAGFVSAEVIESPTITALSNRITTEVSSLRSQIDAQNAAIVSLESRVAALENASSTSFLSLASVSEAVNGLFNSASEWVVGKVTAALGVFTRLEVGTVRVSDGIEMLDPSTGELYCVTLNNHDWQKTLGACGTIAPVAPSGDSYPTPTPAAEEPANDQEEAIVEDEEVDVVDEEEADTQTGADEPGEVTPADPAADEAPASGDETSG
jgi:hypothetical protein